MLWCDMVKTWCYILLYEIIMFCNRSYRQLAGAIWLSLYCMQCNRHVIVFTLSLSGSNSRRSNRWRNDNDATMEIKVSRRWRWWSWRCFGDGDHKHKMMMAISYHLYWLHVMFILYASYLALIDGSIIRKSLTKLSRYKCSPWVCTVAKVRRAQTPRDDRVW